MRYIAKFGIVVLICALVIRVCFAVFTPSYKTYDIVRANGTTDHYTVEYYGDVNLSFYDLLHFNLDGIDTVTEYGNKAISWVMTLDFDDWYNGIIYDLDKLPNKIGADDDSVVKILASAGTYIAKIFLTVWKPTVSLFMVVFRILATFIILSIEGTACIVVLLQNIFKFIFGDKIFSYTTPYFGHGGAGRTF